MGYKSIFQLSIFINIFTFIKTVPERGDIAWTMLLCKYRGNDFLPHDKEWYEKWLTDENTDGSIGDFFRKASNGIYTVGRSQVYGWFELPYTKGEIFELANQDIAVKTIVEPTKRIYVKTKEMCNHYASDVLNIRISSSRHVITIINDEDTAVFCIAYGVLVTPRFLITAAVVHEMAHSFNLGHSYSDVKTKVFSHAEYGEYDDRYDLMSTANAYMYKSIEFGSIGPGFNGPTLDYLGWLPSYRLYFFGQQESDRGPTFDTTIKLSSLSRSHASTTDWLLILIPYDRDDPQKVYTVELRTPENLDVGIPKSVVLVHQIDRRETSGYLYAKILNQGGFGPSYELGENEEWRAPADPKFGNRLIKIKVNRIDQSSATASIEVFSSFSPTSCAKGEVQRSAVEFDIPCVSISERAEIRKQNERNSHGQWRRNGQCLLGLVERKAGPDDTACVTQTEKAIVDKQNEKWRNYKEFYTRPTFGLNACERGYVWRQIDPYDYVCVEESRKKDLEIQDQLHVYRHSRFSNIQSNQCVDGFVRRKATPNDDICVTLDERFLIEIENTKNVDKFMYQKFFNADSKTQP